MPGKQSLFVNGKNRDNLVEEVKRQVSAVKASLIDSNVLVVGVLAFTQNNWPWVGKPKLIDGVYLNSKGISEVINDFNLDLYYGTSLDWKITKRFILNTNIRFNKTWDKLSESVGFKKENPIMFMIGTNFQF